MITNIVAAGVTQYTFAKLVISALISEINILSFKILKIFWLNKTQNIKVAIGINLANSYLFMGQRIVLILLSK
jgi:hypothetical protein